MGRHPRQQRVHGVGGLQRRQGYHGADARTLAVGDTPYDILAAHRIPLAVAAVLSGGFERALLAKAEFLFDDVHQLERETERIDAYFRE